MLPQCHASSAHICPACPNEKRPIIVKGELTGVLAPCSVVTPPAPPVSVASFLCDGFGPNVVIDGTGLVQPSFTASYVGEPTEVILKNNQGLPDETIALPATSFQSAHTYNLAAPGTVTWTLCANGAELTHSADFVEPPLAVNSFVCDGFGPTLDVGTPLVSPSFLASYTGTPTSVTVQDNQGNPPFTVPLPATSFSAPYTYNPAAATTVVWTLTAQDADETVVETHSVQFVVPQLNITSFTTPDFTAASELGDPGIVNPDFNVTFDNVPTSVVFTDNKGNTYPVPGPYSLNMTFQAPFAYNPTDSGEVCTFTVTADNGGAPDSETLQTTFVCNQYIGWLLGRGAGDNPPYTAADILGMQELVAQPTTDALFDVTLTPDPATAGGDVYVVHAFCKDLDTTRAFTDYRIGGALPGGFIYLYDLTINGIVYEIWRTTPDQNGVPTGGVQYEAFQ